VPVLGQSGNSDGAAADRVVAVCEPEHRDAEAPDARRHGPPTVQKIAARVE
jgi:hypothetical protein